jgi:hypothetical protein
MDTALRLVKTSGDLMKDPDKEATVPVPLPCVMVQVKGPFTALDRKLWALCLHLGWDELETKSKIGEWHEISEIDIRRLIEKFSGTKGMNWIWESAQRLTETTVRYSRVDENDKRWKGISALFMAECPEKEERDGVFRYMFPAPLIPIFREPGRFARLRVQFLLGLKSKYAVTLYELFEGKINKRVPVIQASVKDLRQWLQVPEGKLKQWDHLWNKALKPAVDEINADPKESGFSVSCELKRGGRGNRVQGVVFVLKKHEERKADEERLKTSKKAKENARLSQLIPPFRGTAIYTKAKKMAPQFDIYYLEQEWREWVSSSDVAVKNPEAHFLAFVKKKVAG